MNELYKVDFLVNTGKKYNIINFIYYFMKPNPVIRYIFFFRHRKNIVCNIFFLRMKNKYGLEIYSEKIGKGLYIGHPYNITINQNAIIGEYCNIHKGVTIGQENRGKRKGCPIIGNKVWMGVNSTIVGKINIGDDVLIAPNSFVNCDIPAHSIVYGNPCIIKHKEGATKYYIN